MASQETLHEDESRVSPLHDPRIRGIVTQVVLVVVLVALVWWVVNNTIDNLISRARALKLRAPGREYELRNAMVRLLNNKVAHQLHASRRQWFAV